MTKTVPSVAEHASLPSGFVYVNDSRMIQHMAYATDRNFMGRPVAGYKKPRAILTEPASRALKNVQDELDGLNQGYALFILDAYRPTDAVADFQRWRHEPENPELRQRYHPDLEKDQLFEEGYIAAFHSSHSRGSTVDLSIAVRHPHSGSGGGKEAYTLWDMGTILDFFGQASHTDFKGISDQAIQNRRFLKSLMEKHGFVNLYNEWWHYTLAQEPYPETYFNFPVE